MPFLLFGEDHLPSTLFGGLFAVGDHLPPRDAFLRVPRAKKCEIARVTRLQEDSVTKPSCGSERTSSRSNK